MEKWQCDKCGQYFDKVNVKDRKYLEIYLENLSVMPEHKVDLCSDCLEEFNRWLEEDWADSMAAYVPPKTRASFSGRHGSIRVDSTGVTILPSEPTLKIGDVHPLPNSSLDDKEFPKKVLEEAAEVYSAWEDWREADAMDSDEYLNCLRRLANECGDVIQTCANIVYAVVVKAQEYKPDLPLWWTEYDMRPIMADIEKRNRMRGRYDVCHGEGCGMGGCVD